MKWLQFNGHGKKNSIWSDYRPNAALNDEARWVPSREFSIKAAWDSIRRIDAAVGWYQLAWLKDHIPRCSFIFWLTCRDRLMTRDRLARWGIILVCSAVWLKRPENICFFSVLMLILCGVVYYPGWISPLDAFADLQYWILLVAGLEVKVLQLELVGLPLILH